MARVVRFADVRQVEVVDEPAPALDPGQVRVRTLATGISAGTELTAYRGTNPYLNSSWDPERRIFLPGNEEPGYPLDGWGYSEAGRVLEVAPTDEPERPDDVAAGDLVWGIWGHRSEAVLAAEKLRGHRLPDDVDPAAATFVRVGSIALNAVLCADLGVGSSVAIFGQGVIGLIATRLARLNGATVVAVEQDPVRQETARRWGAGHVLSPADAPAMRIRDLLGGDGCDVAIELSGNQAALQEAIRSVGADGTVVASGFYQGTGDALRLGEEFHHNRVQLLASQIGSVPNRLRARWDVNRLQRTVASLIASGALPTAELISHRFELEEAAEAYRLLDRPDEPILQVILENR